MLTPPGAGGGLGTGLVERAVEVAGELGVPAVYLFTPGQEAFYARLGWALLRRAEHHGRPVAVMRRSAAGGVSEAPGRQQP